MTTTNRRWLAGPALFLALGLVPLRVRGAELPPRAAVIISVDGLRPACYTNPEACGVKVPNLLRLMERGAFARGVIGVLPSSTYPSHTTLITGVPPRVHGIESNTVFDPDNQAGNAWNWYAKYVKSPSLVSAAREARLHTATVWWPVSVGIGSDWTFPEFWRPGSESRVDLDMLDAVSTPGLIEAVTRERGRPFAYPITDDERVDVAIHVLKAHRPELLLLHLVAVDSASHHFGPRSPEARAAVEATDARIGLVLAALDQMGAAGRTAVAIVSDHGFLPVSRSLAPNSVLREAGLVRVDPAGRVISWRAFFHANGGSAGLVLHDPTEEGLVSQVRSLFEPRLRDPRSGLAAILDTERIAELGGAARWRLALDAQEGFDFSSSATGDWSVPSKSLGNHGYAPDRPELFASLVIAGPGLSTKGDLGVVPMTAIGPTIAAYLGLRLGPEAHSPLPIW